MKKEKLIELLGKLPPGADVFLWNGYAQDYNDISANIVCDTMTRHSLESWINCLRAGEVHKSKNFDFQFSKEELDAIKSNFLKRREEWELQNQFLSDEQVKALRYKTKKVYLINMKLRGKNDSDRMGKINY